MSFLTLRALLFVAECLLASLVLPLLAFAATRFVHRAALRHLVWLTLFGVLAALPLAALLLPARQIVLTEPAPVTAPAQMESIIALPPVEVTEPLPEYPGEKRIPAPALDMIVTPPPVSAFTSPVPAPAPVPGPLLTLENGLLLLVLLWAAGLAWNLGRMALGGIGLVRLRRQSDAFSLPDAPCELRLSQDVSGPATFGILRPLVVLPQAARGWSEARLAAVLAHEAAHVRRHDIAGQSLARLVCAVFWFNPLLWLAARALRREAEFAADDAVLASGMTPSIYAAELVALVSDIVMPQRGHALSMGMADSPLLTRVQSVLAENVSRKGVTAMDIGRMFSLGLVATVLLGAARVDLALAQDKPANPAAAAQAAPAARPAPAAPPVRSTSPNVEIEIERSNARRLDVEMEALKARAAALRADSARMAAASAEMKARADQMVAETRPLLAQAEQQAKEALQRAREAEQRALEAKAQADEAWRRLEREKQSLLAPLSDEEKAGFAAARQLKITVSPVEVNERLRAIQNALDLQQTDQLRARVILDLAREKMAALQVVDVRNAPVSMYRVSEIFLAVDRPENDARVWAKIEAIEQQIRAGAGFRDQARQHSQHPTAKLGGDKGWATAEQLDAELAGVVTALKVGELSRPVRGHGGWYLLGLQDTRAVVLPAQADSISLAPGEVQTITFPRPVGSLNVSNPAIVDIMMLDARRAFILGKSYGSTNIIALGRDREPVSNTQVRVLSRPQEEQRAPETQQGAVAPSVPPGTLPLARLLLPLPPGAAKEAVDNTMKVAMQVRQAADSCETMEKIAQDPVLKGSVFMNMGNYVVANLHPELQKALAQIKSGESAMPVILDAGVELFARCDKRAVTPSAP